MLGYPVHDQANHMSLLSETLPGSCVRVIADMYSLGRPLPWAIDIPCISKCCANKKFAAGQRSSNRFEPRSTSLSLSYTKSKSIFALINEMEKRSCDQCDILRRHAASLGVDDTLRLARVLWPNTVALPSTGAHAAGMAAATVVVLLARAYNAIALSLGSACTA